MTAHYRDLSGAKCHADRPDMTGATMTGTDTARPDTARPDTARPGAIRPGAVSGQDPASGGFYRAGGKRLIDIVIVVLALPFIVLVVGVLAAIVACDGARPFYSQGRIGRNGRIYRMWKLRSMVVDADAQLESHLAADPQARAEWDSTQKLRDDPRITAFGGLLRRSSMDELPQLWNVLRGDMSLVGPRPMMPSQARLYPGRAYYDLRPGITGSWQVSARNASTFADRAGFDTSYDRDLTLAADARILAATVRVVARATGY